MPFCIPPALNARFTTILRSYAQDEGLPFASVLTAEQIEQAAVEEGVAFGAGPNAVYTPALTLWGFLGQVLAGRKSCVAAVARITVLLVALGRPPCSSATGAYCKARAKLPENFLRRLCYQVGTELEDQAPASWRWHQRRVLLVDGTEVPLSDTPANQAAYPQPTSQQPGLGFPMIRLVVLLAFATAVIIGASFGPYAGKQTGETALLRALFEQLRPGDVVVADRYYCSYFMIAMLQPLGVDVVFRLHQKRKYDFRRGRRLGRQDHVVEWRRPVRPTWMDEDTYATMPETLTIRELRFHVDNPGYRTQSIVVATTLIDDHTYSKEEIADLYHQRWQAELDLRSIKQTLGMKEPFARLRRWRGRNCGRTCWVITWHAKWRLKRRGNTACVRVNSASREWCRPWRRSPTCCWPSSPRSGGTFTRTCSERSRPTAWAIDPAAWNPDA